MAPGTRICKNDARFLWNCCLMRAWKPGLCGHRKNYHAWACRASACLKTLQVSRFGTWHYSLVLFEILLPLATATGPSLSSIRDLFLSILSSEDQYWSPRHRMILSKPFLRKSVSKCFRFCISLRAEPHPDIPVPFKGSSFQCSFSYIANKRGQIPSNKKKS